MRLSLRSDRGTDATFMYAVNGIRAKEGVLHKGIVILPLKAVNTMGTLGHGLDEGPFQAQLIPCYPHQVTCTVSEFLWGGEKV